MRIAIVEFSKSHEECIYTQISFLKENNNEVTLIAHPSVINQIYYKDLFDNVLTLDFNGLNFIKSLKKQIRLVLSLSKFDKIIFNTASSSKKLRNIVFMLLFFKVQSIGILHNTKKLKKSFTQKIISLKIKKYFVLSDFLKLNAVCKNQKIKVESFYPIFFPNYKIQEINKSPNEKWFCIPGRVEFNRRDYLYLLSQIQNKTLSKNIKFIILGNINSKDGILFKEKVFSLNLGKHFIFFNKFIHNEEYYNYINKSDFILPLLKKDDSSYLKNKISGTFNLAYGFKKKLLCHTIFKEISDITDNAVFYDDNSFVEIINSRETPNTLNLYSEEKWSYTFQYHNFINFINN